MDANHPTSNNNNGCDYLTMPQSQLNHISKRGPWSLNKKNTLETITWNAFFLTDLEIFVNPYNLNVYTLYHWQSLADGFSQQGFVRWTKTPPLVERFGFTHRCVIILSNGLAPLRQAITYNNDACLIHDARWRHSAPMSGNATVSRGMVQSVWPPCVLLSV